MSNQWLSWLNCSIAGAILCLLLGIGFFWFKKPSEILCSNPSSKNCTLPKGAFSLAPEAYNKIGEPLLALQSAPPSLQLPDLRQHLVYYGKNGRPDAQAVKMLLHFSFLGSKNIVSTRSGENLYLLYDKKSLPSRYTFSPDNAETSLWVEALPGENEASVKVVMKNDKGELIAEPEAYAQFKLPEKEFIRYAGSSWEIGGFRVDGTILARQRARWFGQDRFLEHHGGDDYKQIAGKQRIDFGENDEIYSIFVGVGDCLIWEGKQWKNITPSEESVKHPLLVVKKIDERLMTFELWDVDGKGKLVLNLLKSTEPWIANQNTITQMFKFVGARTRTQCVFEINRERMILCPSDWLLMTSKGWKKLTTPQEIDDYVKRKTHGTLFVFEGLTRKDDKQIMKGTLYNPSRSDLHLIEMPIQRGSKPGAAKDKDKEKDKNKERDLDDEELLEAYSNGMMLKQEQLLEQNLPNQIVPLPSGQPTAKDQPHKQ